MSKLVKGLTLAALVSITPVALAGSHAVVLMLRARKRVILTPTKKNQELQLICLTIVVA